LWATCSNISVTLSENLAPIAFCEACHLAIFEFILTSPPSILLDQKRRVKKTEENGPDLCGYFRSAIRGNSDGHDAEASGDP
jgi:hypothetical protein